MSCWNYQPNTTQSSCIEADKGFVAYGTYNGIDVSAEIITSIRFHLSRGCEAGKFTNQTGQVECLMTQRILFLRYRCCKWRHRNPDDQYHPAGTYQGEIEQSSCDNASAGHYSLGTYTHTVTFPATGETVVSQELTNQTLVNHHVLMQMQVIMLTAEQEAKEYC